MNPPTSIPIQIHYFAQAIEKEISIKKHNARRQMAAHMDEAIAQGLAQAGAEAEARISSAIQAIQKSNAKRIAEAAAQARRGLTELTGQLTAQLFEDIKADIIVFIHSPGYKDFLINSIQSALVQNKHHFAYVQLPQYHMAGPIQEATGLTPEPGHESDIGGYKLLSANRSRAADFTFRHQLSRAMEAFLEELDTRRTTWQQRQQE